MAAAVRVLVAETTPLAVRALSRVLESAGDITVVATATSAAAAAEQVARRRPDVVALNLDIPGGGGQEAIARIMSATPTPILVLSSPAGASGPDAVAALAAGAVEAFPRPAAWSDREAEDLRVLVRRVRRVPVIGRRGRRARPAPDGRVGPATGARVVAIAASTGGPAAVAEVLRGLTGVAVPVLVVQHIHRSFAEGFAGWLSSVTGRAVHIARDGESLRRACVYVAPGDRHLRLGPGMTTRVTDEPSALHRPSADVLFESVAAEAGRQGIGIVLTGMGSDGAAGLAALRAAGGAVFAQDEASSVVFGMPQAAVRAGAAQRVLPLADIAGAVRQVLEGGR